MKLGRLRYPEWIVGIGGAALIGLLFAPWYEGTVRCPAAVACHDYQPSAWQAFDVADVVLAAFGALGVALFVVTAAYRTPAISIALGSLCCLGAIAAVVIVLIKLLSEPTAPAGTVLHPAPLDVGPAAGAYLGLAAALAMAVGSWLSVVDERPGRALLKEQARRGRPALRDLPAPPARGDTASEGRS